MSGSRVVAVALALIMTACLANVRSDPRLVGELQQLQARDHLSLAQVYGTELTVIMFGREAWLKVLDTQGHYFYGVAFEPGQGWFVGSTDTGLIAMDLGGHVLWQNTTVPRPERLEWSPDGKRLAFVGRDATTGVSSVQVLDIVTQRRSIIATNGTNPGWIAADRLGYCLGGQLRVETLGSGQSTTIGRGVDASWSASAGMVAYRSDDGGIYIGGVGQHGAAPRAGAGDDIVGRGEWSPDGKFFSFVAKGSGRILDLGLNCPEPRRLMVLRVADGAQAKVHEVCKSAPAIFSWATVGP